MDNAVVKSTIKYVKEHFKPFKAEELAKAICVSAEDAKEAIGQLAYLGIVEIDDRDGRIFPNYSGDFIIKDNALVKYIGDDARVVIPEGVDAIGVNRGISSDVKYGVPGIWNWASITPREIVIPSTVVEIAKDAFSELPNDTIVIYPENFTGNS